MKLEMVSTPTRLLAMCLGPEAGGAFDIREVPRRSPGPDEIEIAVEAASVNPIDVRRAAGYGRRLLSLMGASRFPMTLGNDLHGRGRRRGLGSRVGLRNRRARLRSEASFERRNARLPCARKGRPRVRRRLPTGSFRTSPRLPYSFVTMWLAAAGAGVTRQNAAGKEILVHGAAGGLGTLALQTLSEWGARVTAVAKASDLPACFFRGERRMISLPEWRGRTPV